MSRMTTIERNDPPYEADERTMLVAWLEYHRATLELKCEGLTDDQLRMRSVPPSNMSLLGLVRHMAEVELNWFRFWLAGEPPNTRYDDDDEWDVDGADVEEAFDYWRSECDARPRGRRAASTRSTTWARDRRSARASPCAGCSCT